MIGGVVLPDNYMDGGCFLDILCVGIEGAVGRSEDVAVCNDGATTVGGHLSWRHQANLEIDIILKLQSKCI